MNSLGPRQQSVVIVAVTVVLLGLTLALTFSDSIKGYRVLDRLKRAEIAGLLDRVSVLSGNAADRPTRSADSSLIGSENDDLKYAEAPAALDYSWLKRLPEKVPIDLTTLQDGSISWTQEAEDTIIAEIERVQFPTSCSKAKWLAVPMHMGGLLSDVHQFQASLLFGVSFGYTVVPLPNSHLVAFAGCTEKSLHCFFQPYTNCSFYDSPHHVAFYKEASIGAPRYPAGARRGAFAERNLPAKMASGALGDLVAVPIWPHYRGAPCNVKWFDALFERLRASGSIQIHGQESYAHKEFMLYSVLSKWTMRPIKRIEHLANRLAAEFPDVRGPVLGLHVRQTDKTKEDPFYVANGRYRTADELFEGVKQLADARTPRWKSAFLMSDSQAFLNAVVANPGSLHLGPDVDILYNRLLNRSVMETGGHNLVRGREATEQTDHFVAGLYVMSKMADYAIATFSSNVGRAIVELLAAERRVTQVSQVGPLADGVDEAWGTNL